MVLVIKLIIIGIDFGDSRTGMAKLNTDFPIATPLPTIKCRDINQIADKAADMIKEYNGKRVVLGLPLNMDGSHGPRADKVKLFASLLSERISVQIDFNDERLTSAYAHSIMNITDTSGKKRKESVDAAAATIILQSYFDKNKSLFE